MRHPILPLVAALMLATPTLGAFMGGCSKKPKDSSGCSKDTDCKGDRVCEKGTCVLPDQVPTKGPVAGGAAPGGQAATPGGPGAAPGMPGGSGTPSGPGGPGAPGAGGGGFLLPGGPQGPGGGGGQAGLPPIKVCISGKCVTMGPNFGSNPDDMGKLFGLARQLMLDGFSAPPGGAPQTKIEICVGTQCITLDDSLKKDPSAILRMLGQLGPGILQQLMQQGFGPGGIFGGPHPRRGQPPGRRGLPPLPGSPGSPPPGAGGPSPSSAPAAALRDFDAIAQAGGNATGQEAELGELSITSVAEDRVVVEGPGREMIVLKVTPSTRELLPRLRMATGKITLRFRILSPPVGKILHGELLAMR